MKTITKRFLKASVAILLVVIMLFGSTITGFTASVDNADTKANVDVAKTGYDVSCTVYFDNSLTKWDYVHCFIGKSNHSTSIKMTQISNTKIWQCSVNYNGATQIAFNNNSSTWGGEDNSIGHRFGYYGGLKSNVYDIDGMMNTNVHMFTPSNSSASSMSRYYYGSINDLNNSTQSAGVKAKAYGKSTYTVDSNAGTTTVATYKLKSYTASESSTGTAVKTATVTMTASPKEGYTFVGWYDASGNNKSTSTTYTYNCSGSDATYYAYFDQNSYTVSVIESGATGGTIKIGGDTTNSKSIAHGSTTTLSITAPNGYLIKSVSGAGISATPNATTYSGTTSAITSAKTITVTYEPNSLTATFNDKDGNLIEEKTVTYNTAPTAPTAPTVTGYTFAGWYIDNGTTAITTLPAITTDTTYTAAYTPNSQSVSITLAPTDGGTVKINDTVGISATVNYDSTLTLTPIPATGYEFDGWYEPDDTEFESKISAENPYSFTVKGNVNLVARFTKLKYDITATAEPTTGGTVTLSEDNVVDDDGDITVDFGTTLTLTATPNSTNGYSFDGWYLNDVKVTEGLSDNGLTLTVVADGDKNYVAKFIKKCDVYINNVKKYTYEVGSTVELSPALSDDYYSKLTVSNPNSLVVNIVDGKYVFEMPDGDVYFESEIKPYRYIHFATTENVTVVGRSVGDKYIEGQHVAFDVIPNEGVKITHFTTVINGVTNTVQSNPLEDGSCHFEFDMPDWDIEIEPLLEVKYKAGVEVLTVNIAEGDEGGTVTRTLAGGTVITDETQFVEKGTFVTYEAIANEGYDFIGFYKDANCNTPFPNRSSTTQSIKIDKTTVVYALFAKKHYIKFSGGSQYDMTFNNDTKTYEFELTGESPLNISSSATSYFNIYSDTTNPEHLLVDTSDLDIIYNKYSENILVEKSSTSNRFKIEGYKSSVTYPMYIYFKPHSLKNVNKTVDLYITAERSTATLYISSGRRDFDDLLAASNDKFWSESSIDATGTYAGITKTDEGFVERVGDGGAKDTDAEQYVVASVSSSAMGKTVRVKTTLGGDNVDKFEVTRYLVYDITTKRFLNTVTATQKDLSNDYYGDIVVTSDLYIVPIIERTNGDPTKTIRVYFDANAISDLGIWGPFVSCYAYGTYSPLGGWPGQLMTPSEIYEDMFYTDIYIPDGDEYQVTGILFSNYIYGSVPKEFSSVFGLGTTNYQTYDYREGKTLTADGYKDILFVTKKSLDGYHGYSYNSDNKGATTDGEHPPKPGNTAERKEKIDFDANDFTFDYLFSRDGKTPMDLNRNKIPAGEESAVMEADYYIISMGDVDVEGSYAPDSSYRGDWSVFWYVYDSEGNYITDLMSDSFYNTYNDDGTTGNVYSYLVDEIVDWNPNDAIDSGDDLNGKTVAISYEAPNNNGHQIAFDGQWYANRSTDKLNAKVEVALYEYGDYTFEGDNEADYGKAVIDGSLPSVELTYANNVIDLSAEVFELEGRRFDFVGWYTKNADDEMVEANVNTTNWDDVTVLMDETFYAVFEEVDTEAIIINHTIFDNARNDATLVAHGGRANINVKVYKYDEDADDYLFYKEGGLSDSKSTVKLYGAVKGDKYKIKITTDGIGLDKFYAWYLDSVDMDGNLTYEEIRTKAGDVDKIDEVSTEFIYTVTEYSNKSVNIYSDLIRVDNKATVRFIYRNRFGETRTVEHKDLELSQKEFEGYEGNGGYERVPQFVTHYQITAKGNTTVIDDDWGKIPATYDETKHNLISTNRVQELAPKDDVTQAYNEIITWELDENNSEISEGLIIFNAVQTDPMYTYKYQIDDGEIVDHGEYAYNTLVKISAPQTITNGNDTNYFLYWQEMIDAGNGSYTPGDILCYTYYYNYRVVRNMHVKAVYGTLEEKENIPAWNPIIDDVTYTREFDDTHDYVYADHLIAFTSSSSEVLDEIKDAEGLKVGLYLVRDRNQFYTETQYKNSEAPSYPDVDQHFKDKVELLAKNYRSNKSFKSSDGNKIYDAYHFDITNEDTTDFNRINYYVQFDVLNNEIMKQYTFAAFVYLYDPDTQKAYVSENPVYVNVGETAYRSPFDTNIQ